MNEPNYARIAAMYNEAMRTTRHPAKMLAEQLGVPVHTVHSWIYRARRNGYLPAGRQGTARSRTALERVADEFGIDPNRLREAIGRHAPSGFLR